MSGLQGRDLAEDTERQALQFIELRWFFRMLELLLLDGGVDPFNTLSLLLKSGLQLYFDASERSPCLAGDLSGALARVREGYEQLDEEEWEGGDFAPLSRVRKEAALWNGPLAADGRADGLPIGSVYVSERQYAAVRDKMGRTSYSWPQAHWPQQMSDLEERSSEWALCVNNQGQARHHPPISPAPSKQAAREKRLRAWLDQSGIPENQWKALAGYTLKDIYRALCEFPVFRSDHAAGDPIEFSTFKRKFWCAQQICKLPDNRH